MSNRDDLRKKLRDVSSELATKDELLDRRAELVAAARSQDPPMTWREIASILGMTEQGLIKAQKAYRERSKVDTAHRATA